MLSLMYILNMMFFLKVSTTHTMDLTSKTFNWAHMPSTANKVK